MTLLSKIRKFCVCIVVLHVKFELKQKTIVEATAKTVWPVKKSSFSAQCSTFQVQGPLSLSEERRLYTCTFSSLLIMATCTVSEAAVISCHYKLMFDDVTPGLEFVSTNHRAWKVPGQQTDRQTADRQTDRQSRRHYERPSHKKATTHNKFVYQFQLAERIGVWYNTIL